MNQKEPVNPALAETGLLGRQIIAGKVETGVKQVIDVFDGKIVFRKPMPKEKKVEAAGA